METTIQTRATEDTQPSGSLMEYTAYIDDIRRRIYRLAVIFILVFVVGFFFAGKILGFLISFFKFTDVTIAATSPFQYVDLAMNIGLFCGLLVLTPLIIHQVYSFLKPALTKREKRLFLSFIPITFTLFVIGFAYGIFTLSVSLDTLARINTAFGISNVWDIGKFISQVSLTGALLGLIFEFPAILTFLIRINVLKPAQLRAKRRHAIVVMFIFTALLPPTDVISLLILVLPLLVLYEITIIINRAPKAQETITQIYV